MESVATQVTKCCEGVDKCIAGAKAQAKERQRRTELLHDTGKRLLKELPPPFVMSGGGSSYVRLRLTKPGQDKVDIRVLADDDDDDESAIYYELSVKLDDPKKLLDVVRVLVK